MLDGISNKFSDLIRKISGKASISEKNVQDAVEEIKVALLDADVNLRVVRRFINSTLEEAVGEKVLRSVNPGQQFTKIVYDKMVSFLGDEKQDLMLKGPDAWQTDSRKKDGKFFWWQPTWFVLRQLSSSRCLVPR